MVPRSAPRVADDPVLGLGGRVDTPAHDRDNVIDHGEEHKLLVDLTSLERLTQNEDEAQDEEDAVKR